jgi:hypothetical protein
VPISVEASDVLRTVGELEPRALETVSAFVTQQVSKQRKLQETIEAEKRRRRALQSRYSAFVSMVNPLGVDSPGSRDIIAEITRLKKGIVRLEVVKGVVRKLVATFESFGSRFPENTDIERCLTRIRSWLQGEESDVDVVQEVDFLLGLCLPGQIQDSETSSGPASEMSADRDRVPVLSNFDAEMLKQIRDLKQSVCEMKNQIRLSEEERKSFIVRHLSRQLPMTARWSQICEYLLSSKVRKSTASKH